MKKYLTFSFDDGTRQDIRLTEMLRKYGLSATFNINTGLFGEVTDLRSLGINADHKRICESDIKNGLYDGFEVAVHTLTHPLLTSLSNREIVDQVEGDAGNILSLTGTAPVGMAYPGGQEDSFDRRVIETIIRNTDIKYARVGTTSGSFEAPDDFMKWEGTCGIADPQLMELGEKFVRAKSGLFFVWGHSYELDQFNLWDRLEEFCRFMSRREDIIYATNREVYEALNKK